MEKPPVITHQAVLDWIIHSYGKDAIIAPLAHEKEAQRDADTLYYEPKIEQARQETAREILEEIEEFVVNGGQICGNAKFVTTKEYEKLKSKFLEGK